MFFTVMPAQAGIFCTQSARPQPPLGDGKVTAKPKGPRALTCVFGRPNRLKPLGRSCQLKTQRNHNIRCCRGSPRSNRI